MSRGGACPRHLCRIRPRGNSCAPIPIGCTWGWDYPLIAMTAARVGRPDLAIQALMMDAPQNRYLNNGHNYQNDRLPVYLPGNGGLLAAVAMMAAGWEGAPDIEAPGFPKDGNWRVRCENIHPMP